MESVLVFAPHPDDDIIGSGGSLARHIHTGDRVAIVYMTSGEAGSLSFPPQELMRIREEEATQATALLGITDLSFLRNPDGFLEYNRDNLNRLIAIIRSRRPVWIYVPHSLDAVPDHQVTHQLVVEACRRAAGPWFQQSGETPWSVKNILGYEVWTPLQNIGYCVNINEYINLKIESLQMHKSQLADIHYDEAILSLNRYRGIMTGQGDYCECFQIIKAQL